MTSDDEQVLPPYDDRRRRADRAGVPKREDHAGHG